MDIEKLIKEENKKHEQTLKTIEACRGLEHLIWHISGFSVFTNDLSLNEVTDALHEFKQCWGLYSIDYYYMNGSKLAIQYRFKDYDHHLFVFCTDAEEMLEKISGGKCRVEKSVQKVNKVVCDI
jgi:hypothetical protein